MTNTNYLGLPFIEGSQAQKHITHNEALRILDAVIQIGVLDADRTTPPEAPTDGDRHIVASGAAGAWAGQAHAIAVREDGAWRFLVPKAGWCAWSGANGALLVFDGEAWTEAASGGDGGGIPDSVNLLGINDEASGPNLLTVRSNAALFNAIDVADGGSGDMRVQISKEDGEGTASVLFSNAFSGRAEFGLVESDSFKLKVSDDGETFIEALSFDSATGNAEFRRGVAFTGAVSPPQITSDQDDYAPSDFAAASVLRLSSDASRTVTGLAGGGEGRVVIIHNVGSHHIVLASEDSGSAAANRFRLGGSVTLGTDASLSLRYDGTTQRWRPVSPIGGDGGGGGGAAGMTDSERQNGALVAIYQSKLLAEYRRLVNTFATGFKGATDTLNGISTGPSSNYSLDAANGCVSPTFAAGSDQTATHTGATSGGNAASASSELAGSYQAWRAFDKVMANPTAGAGTWITNGTTFGWLQYQFGSAKTIGSYTLTSPNNSLQSRMARDWTLKGSNTGSFSGEEVTLDTRSSQTGWSSSGETRTYTIASPASFAYYRLVVTANNGDGTYLEIDEMTLVSSSATGNMTLVTAAQTTDSPVSNARVLIEFDNAAAPVLNTDLAVEVTCDGGTNWTPASLAAVTSYSQGGRKVAETADQACPSGTSFAARIKTLNNKSVAVYGANLSAR